MAGVSEDPHENSRPASLPPSGEATFRALRTAKAHMPSTLLSKMLRSRARTTVSRSNKRPLFGDVMCHSDGSLSDVFGSDLMLSQDHQQRQPVGVGGTEGCRVEQQMLVTFG